MALIYKATLTPSKLDLLSAWLPARPWTGAAAGLQQLAAYRFDDPAGEVGMEGFLLAAGDGRVLHVPLTYRAAPLAGAEEFLVGTTEHSVLGTRWVYDGCADPVWAAALVTTILTGGTQAELLVDAGDGRLEPREPAMSVTGSGSAAADVPDIDAVACHDEDGATVVRAGDLQLVVVRRVGTGIDGSATLTGRWPDGGPTVLAALRAV